MAAPSGSPTSAILDLVAHIQRDVVDSFPDALVQNEAVLLKTCKSCRTARTKCSGGTTCARCRAKEIPCEYAAQKRMGRPLRSAKHLKLQGVQRDLIRLQAMLERVLPAAPSFDAASSWQFSEPSLLASSASAIASSSRANLDDSTEAVGGAGDGTASSELRSGGAGDEAASSEPHDEKEFWWTLTNPIRHLAITTDDAAEASRSPNNLAQALPLDSPKTTIYDHVLEEEAGLDPVALGYLNEADFQKLLNFFYEHLHPRYPFLDPTIHTAANVRRLSPFLATVVALSASAYCPMSTAVYNRLKAHAVFLSARIFIEGYRSLDIIAAYCIWTPWSPITSPPHKERGMTHLAQAVRIAAEVRLQLPLLPATIERYRQRLQGESLPFLEAFRKRIQDGLFCLDMEQTLLIGYRQSLPFGGLVGYTPLEDTPEHPSKRWDSASLALNRNAAVALFTFHQLANDTSLTARLRYERFRTLWQQLETDWQRRFGGRARFWDRLTILNHSILFRCFSLRFGGAKRSTLLECRKTALDAMRLVVETFGGAALAPCGTAGEILTILAFVNFAIRFSVSSGQTRVPRMEDETRQLCYRVVEVLHAYERRRLNDPSLAGLFAKRFEVLLAHVTVIDPPTPRPPPPLPPLLQHPLDPRLVITSIGSAADQVPQPPVFPPHHVSTTSTQSQRTGASGPQAADAADAADAAATASSVEATPDAGGSGVGYPQLWPSFSVGAEGGDPGALAHHEEFWGQFAQGAVPGGELFDLAFMDTSWGGL